MATVGQEQQSPQEILQPPVRADWRQVSYTALVEAQFETDRYKLLIQPIPLPVRLRGLGQSTHEQEPQVALLLIGVVSQDKLASEARRDPLPDVSPFAILLFLALLALWPVLKVWKMAPTDGFKIRELLFLACSLLGAVALVTLVTLYELTNHAIRNDHSSVINAQLDNLAHDVDLNLAKEIANAMAALEAASGSPMLKNDLSEVQEKEPHYRTRNSILSPATSRELVSNYPWLDQLAWANADGDQLVKWSTGQFPTRRISFREFDFFPKLDAKDLWTLATADESLPHRQFLFAPINSPLTGRYLPIILHPHEIPNVDRKFAVKFAAVSSYLVSVTNAIMPPNFGFAVIDEHGVVQFHSDALRNIGENLVTRIQPATELQRVILERDPKQFNVRYLDGQVRMHATPLHYILHCPWTLVTWYELHDYDLFMAKVFGQAMLLTIVYLLYFTIICFGFYAFTKVLRARQGGGDEPFLQYFPRQANLSNLTMLALCYVVLGLIYLSIIKLDNPTLLKVSILAIPAVVAIATWIIMGLEAIAFPQSIQRPKAALLTFVIANSCGALLLGAFPALSFTELCWEYHSESFVRDAMIQLGGSLDHRHHSVKREIRNVSGDQQLLNTRIDEKLDRYDLAFFNSWRPTNEVLDARTKQHDALAGQGLVEFETGNSTETGESRGDQIIQSKLPGYPFRWGRSFGALAVGAVIICFTVWGTLVHRFQWGHKMPPELAPPAEVALGCNKLILTPPWQDGSALFASLDSEVCPLSKIFAEEGWQPGSNAFLIVTGLEVGLRSPELATRTLLMLEALLGLPDKTIILVSAVDPFFWLMERGPGEIGTSSANSASELLRWLGALNAFAKESLYKPVDHRLTIRCCHLLWKCCTAREKLVLWQLVKYKLPNPKNNFALDSLIQRGLVSCRDTRFCIPSNDFANFVRSDVPGREVLALFPPDADSAWRGLRWVLIYMLIVTAAVVSFILADSWELQGIVQILAVGGAVGGAALPVLKTAFDLLPGSARKRESSA